MALFNRKLQNPLKNPKLQEKARRNVWLLKIGKYVGTAIPIIIGAFAGLNNFLTGVFKVETSPEEATEIIQAAPSTQIRELLAELGDEANALRAFVYFYSIEDDQLYAQFSTEMQWARNGLQLISEGSYPVNEETSSKRRYNVLKRLDCLTLSVDQMSEDEPLRVALEHSGSTDQVTCPIPLAENGLAAIAVEFSNEVSDPTRVKSYLHEYGARVGLLIDVPSER